MPIRCIATCLASSLLTIILPMRASVAGESSSESTSSSPLISRSFNLRLSSGSEHYLSGHILREYGPQTIFSTSMASGMLTIIHFQTAPLLDERRSTFEQPVQAPEGTILSMKILAQFLRQERIQDRYGIPDDLMPVLIPVIRVSWMSGKQDIAPSGERYSIPPTEWSQDRRTTLVIRGDFHFSIPFPFPVLAHDGASSGTILGTPGIKVPIKDPPSPSNVLIAIPAMLTRRTVEPPFSVYGSDLFQRGNDIASTMRRYNAAAQRNRELQSMIDSWTARIKEIDQEERSIVTKDGAPSPKRERLRASRNAAQAKIQELTEQHRRARMDMDQARQDMTEVLRSYLKTFLAIHDRLRSDPPHPIWRFGCPLIMIRE